MKISDWFARFITMIQMWFVDRIIYPLRIHGKYVHVVTRYDDGTILAVFNSERKADEFVYNSGKCEGFTTHIITLRFGDVIGHRNLIMKFGEES